MLYEDKFIWYEVQWERGQQFSNALFRFSAAHIYPAAPVAQLMSSSPSCDWCMGLNLGLSLTIGYLPQVMLNFRK